jgi:hypothetical protein
MAAQALLDLIVRSGRAQQALLDAKLLEIAAYCGITSDERRAAALAAAQPSDVAVIEHLARNYAPVDALSDRQRQFAEAQYDVLTDDAVAANPWPVAAILGVPRQPHHRSTPHRTKTGPGSNSY